MTRLLCALRRHTVIAHWHPAGTLVTCRCGRYSLKPMRRHT